MHCSLSQPVAIARVHLLSIALCDAGTATYGAAGCALTVACPLADLCFPFSTSQVKARPPARYQKRTLAPHLIDSRGKLEVRVQCVSLRL